MYVTCNGECESEMEKVMWKLKLQLFLINKWQNLIITLMKKNPEYNRNWSYIPDYPHRTLIIGGSGSGKINGLLSLIENQPDIDKIYLYAKDAYETKCLIKIREKVAIGHHNDPRAYIKYSNDMCDVYKNIDNYNPDLENKILIVFDDIIADMINNRKLGSIVTELFIRGVKLNISLVFITQSNFTVWKGVRLSTTHFVIAKTRNKREL